MTVRRLLVLLACLLTSLFAGVAPAAAHAEVLKVEPADGATLTTAPDGVRLTFGEEVLAGTPKLRVTGPVGEVPTEVSSAGAVVTSPLPIDLVDGTYTVVWRVTSADGHPISGTYRFRLAAGAASASASAPSPSAAPVATPAATPTAVTTPVPPPMPTVSSGGSGTTTLVALAAVLAALAGIGGIWARTRRQRGGQP